MMDWMRLCNIAFESVAAPEYWRSAVIVPLYKGKGERAESKKYRGISLLNVVGKIYAGERWKKGRVYIESWIFKLL